MAIIDFSDWLQSEIDARGWRVADLSRHSGLSGSYLGRVLNKERLAGNEACRAIAKAFGMRDVDVMKIAGLANPEPDKEAPTVRELLADFNALSDEDQIAVLEHAKSLRMLRGQQARRKKATG